MPIRDKETLLNLDPFALQNTDSVFDEAVLRKGLLNETKLILRRRTEHVAERGELTVAVSIRL
jgi:hypothetical protein